MLRNRLALNLYNIRDDNKINLNNSPLDWNFKIKQTLAKNQ